MSQILQRAYPYRLCPCSCFFERVFKLYTKYNLQVSLPYSLSNSILFLFNVSFFTSYVYFRIYVYYIFIYYVCFFSFLSYFGLLCAISSCYLVYLVSQYLQCVTFYFCYGIVYAKEILKLIWCVVQFMIFRVCIQYGSKLIIYFIYYCFLCQ